MNDTAPQRTLGRAVMRLDNVVRTYREGEGGQLEVLKGASLELRAGEIVALVGPSGSGKSSLLHVAGLLEEPNGGAIMIDERDCTNLKDRERTETRRVKLGFVYQFHHLLPEFTALENVVMPQLIAGRNQKSATGQAERLLGALGLADRVTHRPAELSGGEQQRVAIARGLANHPLVLLADEPTGNLDPKTSRMVFDYLMSLVHAEGTAALIATHNLELASRMDRVLLLHEGRLIEGRDLAH